MDEASTDPVRIFHAHIYFDYFDADQEDRARALGDAAVARFGVAAGRYHPGPVGPHPRGSCQLTVPPERFGEVAQWLALNRGGLTVFAHACTEDVLADHTDHVIWFGPSEPLRLSIFGGESPQAAG